MATNGRRLAMTGASTGIGYELAKRCAAEGFDLILAADEPAVRLAAEDCRQQSNIRVDWVEVDLATAVGVDKLYAAAGSAPLRSC